jgi:anti-sigma B factor antagonist
VARVEADNGRSRTVVVLRVFGDIDLATAPRFRSEARDLLERPELGSLVLDLSAVDFLDSSGIEMLSSIRSDCLDRDVELVLRSPRDRVVQLLRMTGTLEGFVVDDPTG